MPKGRPALRQAGERAHHVEDAVHGGDVREEGVAQAGALGGAAHQASDVRDLQVGRVPAE